MKIFKQFEELKDISATAVALGNFDGIHKGHQALILECVKVAAAKDLVASVFTFSNHPINVISKKSMVKNIITFEEKADLLSSLGIAYLFSFEFSDYIRNSSPYSFCSEILVKSLKAKEVFCGFNYHFGYNAEGTPKLLAENGLKLGYKTSVIAPVAVEGAPISSTSMRNAIVQGEMDEYFRFTGRRYVINGYVIEGLKFGRRIGFPTINLALDLSMVMPKSGVYITQTCVDGYFYDSITNVGNKPSIGTFEKNAETHIFGFDRDVYGQSVRVEFIKLLRPEMTFQSFDALTSQIEIDCRKAKEYHANSRKDIK